MKKTMTAWETFRSFCSAWFERRCAEEVCTYLGDEFCFVGTGEDEFAHSPQEMREYLVRDIQEIPEPFSVELELFQEQIIDEDTRNLSVGMILKNTQYRWRLRGFLLWYDVWGLALAYIVVFGTKQQSARRRALSSNLW